MNDTTNTFGIKYAGILIMICDKCKKKMSWNEKWKSYCDDYEEMVLCPKCWKE